MPCTGDGTPGVLTRYPIIVNWARTRWLQPPNMLLPRNVTELAAAVSAVETSGGVLRAIGSNWSYPEVALTRDVTHVVDTSALRNILNGDDASSPASTLLPFAFNVMARKNADNLIHVEAGIKIHDLNCALEARGKAMKTLGGSAGQSVAGVMSTGTHGSDVDLAPIADQVRAIHLVGPGGLEWWIEPQDAPITDLTRMQEARDAGRLCNDIRIAYDTELFNAVLVSCGRMGVIYAVVVEVTNAYQLREERVRTTWAVARTRIRNEVFDRPLPAPNGSPRFVEVALSPYANTPGEQICVISTRFVTTDEPDQKEPGTDYFGFVCNMQPLTVVLSTLLALIPGLIAAAVATALAGLSWMLAIPFIGPILYGAVAGTVVAAATTGLVTLMTAVATFLSVPGEDVAQKLANIVNLATRVNLKFIVPSLINEIVTFQRNPAAAPFINKSFRVMTSQPPCPVWQDSPACMRQIDGLEFALPATPGSTALFSFMDDVFALTREFYDAGRPPGMGLSIRFTRGTRALIGMQKFGRTASVEVLMLRGFTGHEQFRQRLYAIARNRGAIPHWGLIHEIDAAEVSRRYGARLTRWRAQLSRLIATGGGRASTFRTAFSISRGLEPPAPALIPNPLVSFFQTIMLWFARAFGSRPTG